MNKNTSCQICVKEFFKASNLRRHIKRFHPESYEELPKKQFAFTCSLCSKNFSYIRNFRCHLKIHDPNAISKKVKKNCPLCSFVSEKKELYEHFENTHCVTLVTEKLKFENSDNFFEWKTTLENDTNSHFARIYTQKTKFFNEVVLYECSRSSRNCGKDVVLKQEKCDSTKKIGGFCPASIKTMKNADNSILVNYLKTHVGHTSEKTKIQCEIQKKLRYILLRHKRSTSLSKESLIKCQNNWNYHAQDKQEVYIISANDMKCGSECPLTCPDCRACSHKYSCNCKDCSVKSNMCVHIHLLCKVLNEENEIGQKQILPEASDSSMDITDLILYDGTNKEERDKRPKSPVGDEIRHEVLLEEKNVILQEFSDILIKCNSPIFFREIVTIVNSLKARLESEELPSIHDLTPQYSTSI